MQLRAGIYPSRHPEQTDGWRILCEQEALTVVREMYLVPTARRVGRFMANWRAGLAIFELQTKHDR